jgi:hypothetical protein
VVTHCIGDASGVGGGRVRAGAGEGVLSVVELTLWAGLLPESEASDAWSLGRVIETRGAGR